MSSRRAVALLISILFARPSTAAISFPGTSGNYISIPITSVNNFTGVVTMTAWIYNKSVANYGTIIDANKASFGGRSYSMFTVISHTDQFYVSCNNSGVAIIINPAIPLNTWNFVVAIADGAHYSVYVNGVLAGKSINTNVASGDATGFSIGYDISASNYNFNGYIDDARVYNRVLSNSEIQTLASSRTRYPITDGLVFWMPLDGGLVNTPVSSVLDRSQYHNTASAVGSIQWVLSNWITYRAGIR